MKRLTLAIFLTAIAALSPGGGASACACGESKGFVVARGKSPYGVPWRIRASGPSIDSFGRRSVEFAFEMLPPAYFDVGYFTDLGFPISPQFVFSADSGSGLDRYPEADLSGISSSQVQTLTVKMSKGPTLTIRSRFAPPAAMVRHPWLVDLEFFDVFYGAGRKPLLVTARDAAGRVLDRRKSRRGSFSGG